MNYSERTQVLLTPEQRHRLERIAAERGISVGAVIREAIDAHTAPRRRSREEALRSLLAMNAPVDDWPVMKEEIIRSRFSDDRLP
jgi:hypothetical protein